MFQVTTILPESGLVKDIPVTHDGKIDYGKEFFKKSSSLTVSGQLAVENYACSLSNVYTFGPTFRAEVSHTTRHIAEFWMIEPELCFADVYDVIDCAEAYVKYCIEFILNNNLEDIAFLDQTVKKGLTEYLKRIVSGPFARASYTEAIGILKKVIEKDVVFENPVEWGIDLASEHEKYLCDHVFHGPTILYNYPKDIKAFYMRLNEDGKTVASFDVLAPEVNQQNNVDWRDHWWLPEGGKT
jgi:asparaginyl-tRNA synthetase